MGQELLGRSHDRSVLIIAILVLGDAAWQAIARSAELGHVLVVSGLLALVVVGIWGFNVIAYRDGAAIPAKYVTVNGTFLSLTIVIGFLFFGEVLTWGQGLGMLVYLISFCFVNNEVWNYLMRARSPTSRPAF